MASSSPVPRIVALTVLVLALALPGVGPTVDLASVADSGEGERVKAVKGAFPRGVHLPSVSADKPLKEGRARWAESTALAEGHLAESRCAPAPLGWRATHRIGDRPGITAAPLCGPPAV